MSPPEIALTLRMEVADYQDGFTLLSRRRRTMGRVAVVILLPLSGLLLGVALGQRLLGLGLTLLLGLWALWVLTGGQRFFSGVLARRVMRGTPSLHEDLHYRFTPEGLTVALGDQPAGGLSWRMIIGYSRDDKVLILYDSPEKIRVFPRRLVSDGDIAGIIALAEAAGVPQR